MRRGLCNLLDSEVRDLAHIVEEGLANGAAKVGNLKQEGGQSLACANTTCRTHQFRSCPAKPGFLGWRCSSDFGHGVVDRDLHRLQNRETPIKGLVQPCDAGGNALERVGTRTSDISGDRQKKLRENHQFRSAFDTRGKSGRIR